MHNGMSEDIYEAKAPRRIECIVFAALWLLYFVYALWARRQFPLDAPDAIHGWDFNGLAEILSDWHRLTFVRFRHPLFGLFLAPIPLLLGRVAQLNYMVYWGCLSFIFSGFTALGVWLTYRVCISLKGVERGDAAIATAVFASFAYVRYMAVGPESYPISMVLALATLLWIQYAATRPRSARLDVAVFVVLFVLAGGVTITQGVKVVLAFMATHSLTRRVRGWLFGGGAAILALGAASYAFKLAVLGDGGRTVGDAIAELLSALPHGVGLNERLRMLEMFFLEPIVPHGAPLVEGRIVGSYCGWRQYAVCAVCYLLAAHGAWKLRRAPIMRAIVAMALVDIVIHLVLFWGMDEAQIYCAHWFYLLPIFIAAALSRHA